MNERPRARVVVLRALGIGDLLTVVPALRGMRAAWPADEIVLAAPAWLGPLASLTGAVDRLAPVDGLDADHIAVPRPRLAVNLHGRGPQSHRLLGGLGAGRLLAYACAAAGHEDGPQWMDDERETRRWARLLAWYGVTADPSDLALSRPETPLARAGATIVHPGSKDPARRWPAARFAAVARALADAGHAVVVTGSASERSLARQVAVRAGLPAEFVLAGRVDVHGLAALVAHARLLVSGDTGIGHLATAYGTPSVLLFGPASPATWGPPPGRPQHRILWRASLSQRPAGRGPHPALAAIEVAEVLDAARTALAFPVDRQTVNRRSVNGPSTVGPAARRWSHAATAQ